MSTVISSGRSGLLVISLCTLAALAVLLSLGGWQLQRLAWKEDLVATIEERGRSAPVSMEEGLGHDDGDYLRVGLKGTYAHERAQKMYDLRDGVLGWNVLTPIRTDDGKTYWADRGFHDDRQATSIEEPSGSIAVSAVLRTTYAPRGWFTPDNVPGKRLWYWFDQERLDAVAGVRTEPGIVLRLDAPDHDGRWPSAGPASPKLSNRHFGYALTWFGLAVTLLGVYVAYVVQHRRKTSDP